MPPAPPVDRAKRVRDNVEGFLAALKRARSLLPTDRENYRRPPEDRNWATRSSRTAVIGFWWGEEKTHEIIVCSGAGLNMICEITEGGADQLRKGDLTKGQRAAYDEFLDQCASQIHAATRGRDIKRSQLQVGTDILTVQTNMNLLLAELQRNVAQHRQKPENLSSSPGDRGLDELAQDLRGDPATFAATEAEARMASYLMQYRVREPVHFYGSWSPCGNCCEAFRWLSYLYGRRKPPGRQPGDPLLWQIGWVFYGSEYTGEGNDFNRQVLTRAQELGGIAGFLPL